MRSQLLAILTLTLVAAANAFSQYSDALLDDAHLHDIYLIMAPDDWQTLRDNFLSDTRYEATFVWNEHIFPRSTVRSRGSSSRNPIKPGLRVDFDRFDEHQTFDGMPTINLDNVSQDVSLIKERISMKLFNRLGIAAPRVSHAKLHVNGEIVGVYAVVEPIDDIFVQRRLGESGGLIYEYNAVEPWFFGDLGDDPDAYTPDRFEPKEDDFDPERLMDFVRTINRAPNDRFLEAVSEFTDLHRFIRYLAVEQFLAEVDGVTGWNGANNFYLLQSAGLNTFTFMPWDKDLTFLGSDLDILNNTENNVLTRRALEQPELRRAYLDALQEVADIAGGEGGWLESELDFASRQIRPWIDADPLLQNFAAAAGLTSAVELFDSEVERLREFARLRAAHVLAHPSFNDPAWQD